MTMELSKKINFTSEYTHNSKRQQQVGNARTCEEMYQESRGNTACTDGQVLDPSSAIFVGSCKFYEHNSGGFVDDLDYEMLTKYQTRLYPN